MTLFKLKKAKNEKMFKFGKVAQANHLIQKTFTLNLKATLFVYDFDLKSSLLLKQSFYGVYYKKPRGK